MSGAAASLPELSPELWTHILSFCREPPDTKGLLRPQSTLAAALRVSSTFYHAATPHLYAHISVHDLHSLFEGSVPDAAAAAATARSSCVDASPTGSLASKNDLLRHVRSLQIILRPARSYDLAGITTAEQESYEHQEEMFLRMFGLLRYLDYLAEPVPSLSLSLHRNPTSQRRLPLFPRLRHVRIGPNPPIFGDNSREWATGGGGRFGHSLTRLCGSGLTWCEGSETGVYGFSHNHSPIAVIEDRLPPTYILHAEPEDGWSILWGTRNVVYIQREAVYPPEPMEEASWVEDQAYLVQEAIDDSRSTLMRLAPPAAAAGDAAVSAENTATKAKERTSVVIYGMVRLMMMEDNLRGGTLPLLFGDTVLLSAGSGSAAEAELEAEAREEREADQLELEAIERDLLGKVEAEVRKMLLDMGDDSPVLPEQVYLRSAREAEPCPCCGLGCDRPVLAEVQALGVS